MSSFDRLDTVQFQHRMKPAALRIYETLFPGCHLQDLRAEGVRVHVLDQEFGIDSLIVLPSQQWLTIQEKYRNNDALRYGDFTQEYMNAVGTPNQTPGEWFKLGAQLYFYGWANAQETDFEKWALLDVAKYKLLIEQAGGLAEVGVLRQNKTHGRATFYAIPIQRLESAFVADYRQPVRLHL